jgi:hypothetical protein
MKVVVRPLVRSLPGHLSELLRACQELNTTETKALSARLGLATATVNAYFQRAAELLGTTDRFSTVQQAQRLGYLLSGDDSLLVNGDFMEGNCNDAPGNSLPWATIVGWQALCGTPQWVPPDSTGGPGAVCFWGTADQGEAIYQVLRPACRLRAGRTYRLSAEYRFGPVRRDWPLTDRQPMCVDFRVRASSRPLPSYVAPDEPGRIADFGWLRYPRRDPASLQVPDRGLTPEEITRMRLRGGDPLVQSNLATHRAGGTLAWEWDVGVLEWTADAEYDTLTIHPTNHQTVGVGRPEATNELGWGQIRRLRLVALPPAPERGSGAAGPSVRRKAVIRPCAAPARSRYRRPEACR